MSQHYDAAVIQKFADRLYSRARSIVAVWGIFGTLIGAGAGYGLGAIQSSEVQMMGAAFGAVILGLMGYYLGSERAFKLKLDAQNALCQAQIEKNTREHGKAAGSTLQRSEAA